ncbi:hypothetical protein BDQ17DRAFT_1412640 [Cyathus striatus]|nr:hypothetical protein BDQ17DRAFT_1412640 [Cyathus striatus]
MHVTSRNKINVKIVEVSKRITLHPAVMKGPEKQLWNFENYEQSGDQRQLADLWEVKDINCTQDDDGKYRAGSNIARLGEQDKFEMFVLNPAAALTRSTTPIFPVFKSSPTVPVTDFAFLTPPLPGLHHTMLPNDGECGWRRGWVPGSIIWHRNWCIWSGRGRSLEVGFCVTEWDILVERTSYLRISKDNASTSTDSSVHSAIISAPCSTPNKFFFVFVLSLFTDCKVILT